MGETIAYQSSFLTLEKRANGSDGQPASPVSSSPPYGGASEGNRPKAIVCPYV